MSGTLAAAGTEETDFSKRLIATCIKLAGGLNHALTQSATCVKILILPQISTYQFRVYGIYCLNALTCESTQFFIAKFLTTYFKVKNLLLLLSIGSFLPFMRVIYNLWRYIPCPALASAVSNVGLLASLVVILILAAQSSENEWQVYATTMSVWPWLILTTIVSRLFSERQASRNPFSPVKDLPLLGFLGAAGWVLAMMAVKEMTVCDCLVLMCLDNIIAAMVASAFLGKARRRRHFSAMKIYFIMIMCALMYFVGDVGLSHWETSPPINWNHLTFLAARFCIVLRSVYVKWSYASFQRSKEPVKPPENTLLFYGNGKPKLHRFEGFPTPHLITLDCLFDSGLRDTDLHGMGPLGTEDLYNITENAYVLPLVTIASLLQERDTIANGVMPVKVVKTPAEIAAGAVAEAAAQSATSTEGSTLLELGNGQYDDMLAILLVCVFVIARLLVPKSTSKMLFDKASPIYMWKYQPLLVASPAFFLDLLVLNNTISKFQICAALSVVLVVCVYRTDQWNAFKRKFILLKTQDLHYQAPSAVRGLQRKTLLEFLERTSTDDYSCMLMETAIGHGTNIKEMAREMGIRVWDPAPSATASWKLAFSLVTKSLKRQKMLRKSRLDTKQQVHKFIENIVHKMIDTAVDTAAGHGARLKCAGTLANVTAKRRAIHRLRDLALNRRTLRERRRQGQLSKTPAHLTTAGGALRSVRELQREVGPMHSMLGGLSASQQLASPGASQQLALPGPGAAASTGRSSLAALQNRTPQQNAGIDQNFSLPPGNTLGASAMNTSQGFGASVSGAFSAQGSAMDLLASTSFSQQDFSDSSEMNRGVWYRHYSMMGRPASGQLLVLAFGDARRGQLGVDPSAGARLIARNQQLIVEELRGQQPVQIEAAGVASFVVEDRGQAWAFGSNRSMELGSRKEVAQISSAQRIKSIRNVHCVQIVGSNSASGQAHTLALGSDGEVHTFGASSDGALGQGPDVRQSAPLLLRFSAQVRIKMICAGARHSMLLSDSGRLFSMGDNAHGQLGVEGRLGKQVPSLDTPTAVGGDLIDENIRVKFMAGGDNHSLAVTEDDRLYSWGGNANGQLALGKLTDQFLPEQVHFFTGLGVGCIACGARHSLAITSGGSKVWAWGSNVQGQLGVGENSSMEGCQRTLPSLVATLSNKRGLMACQVAAASYHSLVVTAGGDLYAFGQNSHGQLGFPTPGSVSAVRDVSPVTKQLGIEQPQANRVRAQARNKEEMDISKLFDDGADKLWLPVRVVTLSQYRVVSVSTGDMHTLAIAQHRHSAS